MPILSPYETVEGVAFKRLEAKLKNPTPLLKQVGSILVAASQRAFRDQKFGAIAWKPRYPRQSAPKLNLAGALQDLNKGMSAPKPGRFKDRPALKDTGNLRNSIVFRLEGKDAVVVGTSMEYAQVQHEGGVTTQVITDKARHTLAKLLKTARRSVRNLKSGGTSKEILQRIRDFESTGGPDSPTAKKLHLKLAKRSTKLIPAIQKLDALSKLAFILARPKAFAPMFGSPGEVHRTGEYKFKVLNTQVGARPFIGMTDRSRQEIVRWGERWLSSGKDAY